MSMTLCKKISKIILTLFIVFSIVSCCGKTDSTEVKIKLQNKNQVAKVVAEMQIEKESCESKEEQKNNIDKLLESYGIDTYKERASFAKKVQKYSYQKEFNTLVEKEISRIKNGR